MNSQLIYPKTSVVTTTDRTFVIRVEVIRRANDEIREGTVLTTNQS